MSKIVLTDLANTSDSFIQDLTDEELNLLGGSFISRLLHKIAHTIDAIAEIFE